MDDQTNEPMYYTLGSGRVCSTSDAASQFIVDDDFSEKIEQSEISAEVCGLAGNPVFCQVVQALKSDHHYEPTRKTHEQLKALSNRQYLDEVLVPILMKAISYVTKSRPPSAIRCLARYLLKYRKDYEISSDMDGKKSTDTMNRSKNTDETEMFDYDFN